ncbi:hypothetical protein MRB53_041568 [Persea americana]|nr:hypothetical protein MRB53_041568 [Persea americana]
MAAIRVAPTRATRALNLLRAVQFTHPPTCPCHSNPGHHNHNNVTGAKQAKRALATPIDTSRQKEYAFQMAASNISTVAQLDAMKACVEGLDREGIAYEVYQKVRVEPKDTSIKEAIAFSKQHMPDAFLAVGGGSVIDTAKLMNLYTCCPENDFLDFVNAPLGKGLPISKPLLPLIAVPTTAGTGSETTGTAIFDLVSKRAKTGIAHRNLKPTRQSSSIHTSAGANRVVGICDPLNTRSMPSAVHSSSGLDVLCHSLESWTAIPYYERTPRPTNPILRPAYQGANPISDIFSLQSLRSTVKYLPRAVADPDDHEAQSQMLLAATLAGVGFGNAGVHLCHGLSYGISGQNPGYRHKGYVVDTPIIPHGVSVAVTAPAVFKFTGASNPERHLAAAECFGVDVSNVKKESAGEVLSEALAAFLVKLGDQPRGIKALGFGKEHVEGLVEATIPQARVLMLAPSLETEDVEVEREQLRGLLMEAMEY